MIDKFKKYSVIALASLVLFGCGANDSKNADVITVVNNGKAATISGLRSFGGESATTENLSTSKIRNSADSFSTDSESESSDQICQSGEMNFNTAQNQQMVSFDAKNCNDGYSTINGAASIQMYENDKGMFAEVLRDLTIRDEYFSLFAKKGSFVKFNIDNSNMTFTASFDVSVNNEVLKASNLKVVATEDQNSSSLYIASGEMLIGEYYFKVDPSHDGSTTPIVAGDNGFVGNGVIKLLDGAGHKVEFAVISQNEIAFKIDENGDGVFGEDEIMTENIEELFDTTMDSEESQGMEPMHDR